MELLFEAPVSISLNDSVPLMLDDQALSLLVVGYGVEDRLPGFGYGASEGMAGG